MTEDITAAAELEVRPGFKNTRLGWIPEDWELKPLGEILEFKNGVNAGKESYGTGKKFINVMEVIKHHLITDTDIPGMVNVLSSVFKQNQVKSGDILFNRTSETKEDIGLTTLYIGDEDVVFGGFVIRGRPKNSLLTNNFKKYAFSSSIVRKQIVSKGQGAIRTNVGQKDLEKVYLPIPTDEEQHKITAVLSSWDAAIEKLTLLIEQKELQKKGLMQQLLSGKKRLPGFSGKWEKISAGKLFRSVSIKNSGDKELLSVTQDHGVIPRSKLEARVTMPSGNRDSFKLIRPGNFVISLRSFQGGLEFSDYEGLVSPAYTVLEETKPIEKTFYKHYFKSYDFIGHLAIAVIGIRDGKQISFSDFCTVRIPDIHLAEQKAIAKVLETADNEIDLLKEKLKKLKTQKKGLMQVLLTGKKRTTKLIQ